MWNDIENKKPKERIRVLFCCKVNNQFSDIEIGEWIGKYTENKKALIMDYGVLDDWYPCTHWMNLPKYPNEE